MLNTYEGSCHCGTVRFKIEADVTELTTCDCSLCKKKNAVMTKVHEDSFVLLSGENVLSEYRWNMHIARHYFCSECGIYTFHRKRAQPDHYGINISCLDEYDFTNVPVRATEGLSMTVLETAENPDWPGPRVPASQEA